MDPSESKNLPSLNPSESTGQNNNGNQTKDQAATPPPVWQEISEMSSEAKRNVLMALILVPYLLPDFGPTLGALGIWFWAITASLVGVIVFWLFYRPADNEVGCGLRAFAFTATIGIVLLLVFQFIARSTVNAENPKIIPVGRSGHIVKLIINIIFTIFQFFGRAYERSIEIPANADFGETTVAMIISVGLCEEIVKLLPILSMVMNPKFPNGKIRSVLFVGALSGLGFGIAEGLHYSFAVYRPNGAPWSVYILRFFGCAFGHSALTMLASAAIFMNRHRLHAISEGRKGPSQTSGPFEWSYQFLCLTLSSAVPHGLSNALLLHQMAGLAGLTDAIVIYVVVWLDNFYSGRPDANPDGSSSSPTGQLKA